ncbi:MAG: preprotein translocase subunit SecG [Rhodobacteraceae bacterium]|nr:preprotein translocase subunit SecG [Paracoccaceae bacterium]
MENVILVIHLILALALIAIVLLQRSEGGGLGIGGGGGGVMSARGAATAMGKITWFLAISFIVTSMALTILSARNAANSSVIGDGTEQSVTEELPGNLTLPAGTDFGSDTPAAPNVEDLMPPAASDEPLTPPRAD